MKVAIENKNLLGPDNSTYDVGAVNELLAPAKKSFYGETVEERYGNPFDEKVADEGVQVAGRWTGVGKGVREMVNKFAPEHLQIERSVADIKTGVEAAPDVAPVGMTPMGGDPNMNVMGNNVNTDNITSGEDVKFLIESMSVNTGTARRGVISHEQTLQMSEDIAVIEMITGWKPGAAWNAEQLTAGRQLMVSSAEHLQKEAERIIGMGADVSDTEWAEFARLQQVTETVYETVSGATAETGRALSSMNIPVGGDAKAKVVENILFGSGGKDLLRKKAEALAALKGLTPEQLAQQVGKVDKASTMKILAEVWVNGKLSNPMTHAMNMTANTLIQGFETFMVKPTAATIGMIRKGVTGAEDNVSWDEVGAEAFGMMGAFGDALELFGGRVIDTPGSTIFHSATKSELETWHAFTGKNILGRNRQGGLMERAIDVFGEYYVRLPGRFLEAEDNFFKTLSYRKELNAGAVRTAKAEGLQGEAYVARVADLVNNPTKQMNDLASQRAEYETFTGDPGQHGSAFGEAARTISYFSARHPMLKFIVPFVRTPANIVRYATENSILAPVTAKWRSDMAAGGAKRDMALARWSMGIMATAAIVQMYDSGKLTGSGPTDHAARKLMKDNFGWQEFSIETEGGYYNLTKADPMGFSLHVIAGGLDRMKYAKSEDEATKIMLSMTMGMAESFNDKTFFQSFAELFQVIGSPDTAGEKAIKYGTNIASGFVPAWLSLVATSMDTDEEGEYINRSALRWSESAEGTWALVEKSFAARTPGFRENVPPARDWKGEITAHSGAGWMDKHYYIKKSLHKTDPASAALLESYVVPKVPASSQLFISPAAHMIRFGQRTLPIDLIDLDGGQGHAYDTFMSYVGRARASLINNFIETGYGELPDEHKGNNSVGAQMLESLLADGLVQGKMQFMIDYPAMAKEHGWLALDSDEILERVKQQEGIQGEKFPVPEQNEISVPRF